MRRLKSIFRRMLLLSSWEDLSDEERRNLWPPARKLETVHLQNCQLVQDRETLLGLVPKNSVCAEIGIDKCIFSKKILGVTEPSVLHLFDISKSSIALGQKLFQKEIEQRRVIMEHGNSSEQLSKMPENYFDWVYIDGDHRYEGCKNDLIVSHSKLKKGGWILLNDYTYFSPSDFQKYGVVEAVNEFCLEYNYEFLYLALQGRMYCDVIIAQINAET